MASGYRAHPLEGQTVAVANARCVADERYDLYGTHDRDPRILFARRRRKQPGDFNDCRPTVKTPS